MNNETSPEASALSVAWKKYLESLAINFTRARLKTFQRSINYFDRYTESRSLTPQLLTPSILNGYRGYLSGLGLTNNTIYRHVKNVSQLQAMASKAK